MKQERIKNQILCFLILFFVSLSTLSTLSSSNQDNYPQIAHIEELLFGKTFSEVKISERLSKIEKAIFGKIFPNEELSVRTQKIDGYVLGQFDTQKNQTKTTYETAQSKEVDSLQFLDYVYSYINNERSSKGLLSLTKDDIAIKVASDQAIDLIAKGYLSYYNLKNQCPDERYTLAGGTGAILEIINGFQKDKNDKKIILSELLAKQLVQAITSSKDNSQILFSPYINHVGCGFSLSSDGRKFVSVIDFLTKGGEFEPVSPQVNFREKVNISGKINPPFKFKAVSVAYFDEKEMEEIEDDNADLSFNDENIKPYFPPQDYIAFTDTAKSNFINILKGIGVIGAIGASPFTGGATAVLAPVLLSSIQNAPPKEIPLKRGIKANSKGEITGSLELNYQGMNGLYFISILAELPNLNFPIVISRRTIRVNSQPIPVSKYRQDLRNLLRHHVAGLELAMSSGFLALVKHNFHCTCNIVIEHVINYAAPSGPLAPAPATLVPALSFVSPDRVKNILFGA